MNVADFSMLTVSMLRRVDVLIITIGCGVVRERFVVVMGMGIIL